MEANVVITAKQFNPSILNQLWLVKNGLLSEDDFQPGCLFSDEVIRVQANQFNLLVVPPQLQFVPKIPENESGALVAEKVGAIVRTLPHTPFTAVGFNFAWHVKPDIQSPRELAKDLFFKSDGPFSQHFSSEDTEYGGYFSKDTLGCRLKLDIKPIMIASDGNKESRLLFNFNFHLDLKEASKADELILGHLEKWNDANEESREILGQVCHEN